jgi:hypothetical protein
MMEALLVVLHLLAKAVAGLVGFIISLFVLYKVSIVVGSGLRKGWDRANINHKRS